jgi:hypothetical protein
MSMVSISSGVGAATGIASAVGGIVDAKKRREFEKKLAFLDLNQRAALEKELRLTTNSEKRLEILSNAVSNIKAAQTTAIITSKEISKSKSEQTLAIAVIGGAAIVLGAIALIKK